MKAISIQQPWAWAIFNGKPVENRTWSTSYRGPLLIHAGKKFDKAGWEEFLSIWNSASPLGVGQDVVVCGGFIGIVDMVDCVQKHDSPWFFGPRGFVFANPRRIEFLPYRGKLGIFDVPEGVVTLP
jgi:hypothetical protein